jgi:hypothetical protein
MQFTEEETRLLLAALSERALMKRRLEDIQLARRAYSGQTAKGRARCDERAREYRAEAEAFEALIGRFEYVGAVE